MPETLTETSQYERQNAVISYCFLGIFILLSRQERFRSRFVRSHARIATIIHFLFLVLVVAMIFSRNFGSMLIFDFSLSNIAYFIGFALLFSSLGIGIIRALQGKSPSIHITALSLKEIAYHVTPTGVNTIEKIPMALSHIPLIGNMIAAKYGPVFYSGERFATWSLLAGICLLWIDPSMTLTIIVGSLVVVWIIYQSISLAIDGSISLLGDYLPTSKSVHIFLFTLFVYTKHLLTHSHGALPHWGKITHQISETYIEEKNEKVGEIVAFPLVNIPYLIKNIHTAPVRSEVLQGCLVTLLFTLSVLLVSPSFIFLVLFASYTGFLSLRYQHSLAIPGVKEVANLIIKFLNWYSAKSQKQTSSFTS